MAEEYYKRDGVFISRKECEEYREKCMAHTNSQDENIIIIKTELAFVKKMMWMILTVLVGGFGGVIFAVLRLGS